MTARRRDRPARGFTLIELAIVLIVIAVLLAIAIPSYDGFVRRSRRAEGKALLTDLVHAQGRFYANQARYATTVAELGVSDASSENGYYVVRMTAANRGYVLNAVPQGVQRGDPCGEFTLNDLGERGVVAATLPVDQCWR